MWRIYSHSKVICHWSGSAGPAGSMNRSLPGNPVSCLFEGTVFCAKAGQQCIFASGVAMHYFSVLAAVLHTVHWEAAEKSKKCPRRKLFYLFVNPFDNKKTFFIYFVSRFRVISYIIAK